MRLARGIRWTTLAALLAFGRGAAGDPPPAHPEPRVIVDIVRVEGPHKRGELERDARRELWGGIVACYRPAVQRQPKLRGQADIELKVAASGKVSEVRARRGRFPDRDVVDCWARHVSRLPLPSARAASRVTLRIQVAPGDPPQDTGSVQERTPE